MSLAYRRNPPLRYPSVQPLYHESYLDAQNRLRHLIDLYRRVDYAKPVVDDSPPKAIINIRLKLKRLLIEGERLAKMEKDNRFMLKNIMHALRGPACVDHYHKTRLPPHTHTLNYTARKQNVERLNRENMAMFQRLRITKTSYSRVQQLMDHKKRVQSLFSRAAVFRKWDRTAKGRKQFLITGQYMVHGYEHIDYEGLKERTEKTHRTCFPTYPLASIPPLPMPHSSRPKPGRPPVDHQRCFLPLSTHAWLPRRRSPLPPKLSARYTIAENKTSKLRSEMIKQQIKALAPKPVVVRSPSPIRFDKEGKVPVHENKATRLRAELVLMKMGKKIGPQSDAHDQLPSPGPDQNQISTTQEQKEDQLPTATEQNEGQLPTPAQNEGQLPTTPQQNEDQSPTTPAQNEDQSPSTPAQNDQIPTTPAQNEDQSPTTPGQNEDQPPTTPGQNEDQPPTTTPEQNTNENRSSVTPEKNKNKNQSALVSFPRFSSQRNMRNPYTEQILLDKLIPMGPITITNRLPPLLDMMQKPRKTEAGGKKQASVHPSKQPSKLRVPLAPLKTPCVVKEKNSFTSTRLTAAVARLEDKSSKKLDSGQQKPASVCIHSNHKQGPTDKVPSKDNGSKVGYNKVCTKTSDSRRVRLEPLPATTSRFPKIGKLGTSSKGQAPENKSDVRMTKGHEPKASNSCTSYPEIHTIPTAVEEKVELHGTGDDASYSQEASDNDSSSTLGNSPDLLHCKGDINDSTDLEEDLLENNPASCAEESSMSRAESQGLQEDNDSDNCGEKACHFEESIPEEVTTHKS